MPFFRFAELAQTVISPHYSTAKGGTVYGDRIEVGMYTYPAGTGANPHRHPQEQVVHVVSGRLRWRIGEDEREVGPGDVIHVPPDAEHAAFAITDATIISCKDRAR